MKNKKNLALIIILMFAVSLTACEVGKKEVLVNIEKTDELNNEILGIDALVKIGGGLWYDKTTGIVYWWNGMLGYDDMSIAHLDTTPTAYYAPNGLPYRYDSATDTLYEIEPVYSE